MAARSLFLSLTRSARRQKNGIPFRSISSSSEAATEETIIVNLKGGLENDDLSPAEQAARDLFFSDTRNVRRQNSEISFKFIDSSKGGAVQEPPVGTNEVNRGEEEKDDLKSRILRLRLPKRSAINILERWVSEGHKISISDLRSISKDLRRSQRYKHALEISEWMVSHEEYELSPFDYAIRIDLMTKVFGIDAAERYFEALPPSEKTSQTYTALLHSYSAGKLIEQAEELYERIKLENIPLTAITYNELMTLYISVSQFEKVPLIVEELKSKNVTPDLFTYNLWVSSCAASLKMDDVHKILDEMSADESRMRYVILAKIYISTTQLVNSEMNSVVESEKGVTQRELISYDFLVILYGGMGNKDMLDRIWKSLKISKQKMIGRNYVCVLSSYVMLGCSKEVSEVIEAWKQSATSEFDGSLCFKLVEAFREVGFHDEATSFHALLIEKGCELVGDLSKGNDV